MAHLQFLFLSDSNAPPFLNCQLSVSSILPTHGSQYGGTVITIRGGYFGTVPANVDVTVGAHICVVSSVTNDQILCQIAKTARKKVITNGGKHGELMSVNTTLKGLSIRIPKTMNFSFVPSGNLMVLGVPIQKHIRVDVSVYSL